MFKIQFLLSNSPGMSTLMYCRQSSYHQHYQIHHNNWELRIKSPIDGGQRIHNHLQRPKEKLNTSYWKFLYLMKKYKKRLVSVKASKRNYFLSLVLKCCFSPMKVFYLTLKCYFSASKRNLSLFSISPAPLVPRDNMMKP